MREAAAELNSDRAEGFQDFSRVRLRVTDTLNEDGSLNVRRYQVHVRNRGMNWEDEGGSRVAVDHLMDGRRLGISADELEGIYNTTKDAITNGTETVSFWDRSGFEPKPFGPVAPTQEQLRSHQKRIRSQIDGAEDRSSVNPFGPATSLIVDRGVAYPNDPPGDQRVMSALDSVRKRVGKPYNPADWQTSKGFEIDQEVSGD